MLCWLCQVAVTGYIVCELFMHMYVLVSQSSPAIVTKTEDQRPHLGKNDSILMCHFRISEPQKNTSNSYLGNAVSHFSVHCSSTNVYCFFIPNVDIKYCNTSCVIIALTNNFTYVRSISGSGTNEQQAGKPR